MSCKYSITYLPKRYKSLLQCFRIRICPAFAIFESQIFPSLWVLCMYDPSNTFKCKEQFQGRLTPDSKRSPLLLDSINTRLLQIIAKRESQANAVHWIDCEELGSSLSFHIIKAIPVRYETKSIWLNLSSKTRSDRHARIPGILSEFFRRRRGSTLPHHI